MTNGTAHHGGKYGIKQQWCSIYVCVANEQLVDKLTI